VSRFWCTSPGISQAFGKAGLLPTAGQGQGWFPNSIRVHHSLWWAKSSKKWIARNLDGLLIPKKVSLLAEYDGFMW
jgi:hypothetical protein